MFIQICSTYQYFIPFYGQIIFHFMNMPHVVYPFFSRTFRLFPLFLLLWTMLLWTFVWMYVFISLRHIYLEEWIYHLYRRVPSISFKVPAPGIFFQGHNHFMPGNTRALSATHNSVLFVCKTVSKPVSSDHSWHHLLVDSSNKQMLR